MREISLKAYQDMVVSKLAQVFAVKWVELYPELDLMTEVPFVPGRRFRADFAFGKNIQFYKGKPKLLHPPGVIIEIHGGVHRIKFDQDEEKAIAAQKLGFKFHRLSEGMIDPFFLAAIAADIEQLIRESDDPRRVRSLAKSQRTQSLRRIDQAEV